MQQEGLFKFHYKIGYQDIGTENEICAVLKVNGIDPDGINPNSEEISEVKFVDPQKLTNILNENETIYAPWFILAMQHMNELIISPQSH